MFYVNDTIDRPNWNNKKKNKRIIPRNQHAQSQMYFCCNKHRTHRTNTFWPLFGFTHLWFRILFGFFETHYVTIFMLLMNSIQCDALNINIVWNLFNSTSLAFSLLHSNFRGWKKNETLLLAWFYSPLTCIRLTINCNLPRDLNIKYKQQIRTPIAFLNYSFKVANIDVFFPFKMHQCKLLNRIFRNVVTISHCLCT